MTGTAAKKEYSVAVLRFQAGDHAAENGRGGMISGLERKTATEYSFFAAGSVMIAATIFELYKSYKFLSAENLGMMRHGFVVSFIFAWLSSASSAGIR